MNPADADLDSLTLDAAVLSVSLAEELRPYTEAELESELASPEFGPGEPAASVPPLTPGTPSARHP